MDKDLHSFIQSNCSSCNMNSLCFKGGGWEEICDKYIKFSKLAEAHQPGAVDLMEKGDDEQKVINNKKQPGKRAAKTRASRRKDNFKKINRKRKLVVTGNEYNPFRGYVDYGYDEETGRWVPVGKYVKYIGKSNQQRYLKRKTNKRLRKRVIDEEDSGRKGNGYRRESDVDYWWELF